MNYLYNATESWNNLQNIKIDSKYIKTIDDVVSIKNTKGTINTTYENLKSRLPLYKEVSQTTCYSGKDCELWMKNYLSRYCDKTINKMSGYWLENNFDEVYAYKITDEPATTQLYYGNGIVAWDSYGVRPVITVAVENIG